MKLLSVLGLMAFLGLGGVGLCSGLVGLNMFVLVAFGAMFAVSAIIPENPPQRKFEKFAESIKA